MNGLLFGVALLFVLTASCTLTSARQIRDCVAETGLAVGVCWSLDLSQDGMTLGARRSIMKLE